MSPQPRHRCSASSSSHSEANRWIPSSLCRLADGSPRPRRGTIFWCQIVRALGLIFRLTYDSLISSFSAGTEDSDRQSWRESNQTVFQNVIAGQFVDYLNKNWSFGKCSPSSYQGCANHIYLTGSQFANVSTDSGASSVIAGDGIPTPPLQSVGETHHAQTSLAVIPHILPPPPLLPPLPPVSQEAQLASTLGTTLKLTPVMQAEWDRWSSLERSEQLGKMDKLTGYSLEREFNIWRNRADLQQLDRDFTSGDASAIERWKTLSGTSAAPGSPPSSDAGTTARSPTQSAAAPPSGALASPASPSSADTGTGTLTIPVSPSSSDTGTAIPAPPQSGAVAPPPQRPPTTSQPSRPATPSQPAATVLSSLIPVLTPDEVAGARVEGLEPIEFLQQGFKVLTQDDAGQIIDRGPYWLATIYRWAQLEEEAVKSHANLVCSETCCQVHMTDYFFRLRHPHLARLM